MKFSEQIELLKALAEMVNANRGIEGDKSVFTLANDRIRKILAIINI